MFTKFADPDREREEALAAYVEEHREDAAEQFDSAYEGHFQDQEAFAKSLVNSDGVFRQFPGLAQYFDYARYGEALFCQDYTAIDAPEDVEGIFVFRVL